MLWSAISSPEKLNHRRKQTCIVIPVVFSSNLPEIVTLYADCHRPFFSMSLQM